MEKTLRVSEQHARTRREKKWYGVENVERGGMKHAKLVVEKDVSIIIPVLNEEENIVPLYEHIRGVFDTRLSHLTLEVIFVDDGSQDDTFTQLREVALHDERVQVIRLRRNFGQTAAIAAGVEQSCGSTLIFMDGDLQNDATDIPRLLEKLNEGYDVVSGWRRNRQDAKLSRKLPSLLANRLISKVTGVHLHDYGCTLKAYRREVFQHVRLYGEMHRFIPAYAALAGARIVELEVMHHARRFGASKYGISRTVRVLLDLLTLKFLGSFGTKPLYAFGIPGLLSILAGTTLSLVVLGQKVAPPHTRVHRNPLLPISILLSGSGVQCIMMGLLAEVLMRTYHESQGKATYVVKETIQRPAMVRDAKILTPQRLVPLGSRITQSL